MGADGIETDVQVTCDGALVLIHDETVDRTTNGIGRVAELTREELAGLDAGRWFGAAYAGERIPLLDAFLDRYLGLLRLDLEIKAPAATGPLIAALLARHIVNDGSVEVTSFSWDALTRVHALLPDLPVGFLTTTLSESLLARVAALGLAQICPLVTALSPALVAHAHERGLAVRTWGIEKPTDLERAHAAGVDGATLNWPEWAVSIEDGPRMVGP